MAKLVELAQYAPAKCLVTGSWAEPEHPLIDFEAHSPHVDPRIYLAPALVHDVAIELLGMVDGKALEAAQVRNAELQTRLAEVEAERDEAVRITNAIDAIESADFRARKKTGRPRKEEVAA